MDQVVENQFVEFDEDLLKCFFFITDGVPDEV